MHRHVRLCAAAVAEDRHERDDAGSATMPRGNPDNLRAAAQRKRTEATHRAEAALAELIRERQPVTFRGLAKTAGVSVDFLYRSSLRARIEELRAARRPHAEQTVNDPKLESQVARALAVQLRELKRRHREELAELRHALAVAQGENLELRRRLRRPTPSVPQ